jgi:nicotinate-nucleotide adenylyltransferase
VPPQSLGILGGTFNPPHLGHIAVASHARTQLGLERLTLMPSHAPPHKAATEDPGPEQRLRMCELAVTGHAGLSACALEVKRGGSSYTVDTLLSLHDLHPDTQFTLILGSDIARTLPSWHRARELPALARVAVAERPGDGREPVRQALAELGVDEAGMAFLTMPPVDISSSQVRERVAHGGNIEELVGPVLAAYISERRLYRQLRTGAR